MMATRHIAQIRVTNLRRLFLVLLLMTSACAPRVVPATTAPVTTAPAAPTAEATPQPVATQRPSPSRQPSAAAPTGLGPTGPIETARVVRVVDGDTIVVDRGHGMEHLRYIGMDTPESVKPGTPIEWLAEEASQANTRLVKDQTVVLEKDVSERDVFGRLLRYVWLDQGGRWLQVDLELVIEGFARVATFPPDVKYAALYLAAQIDARNHSRGLWGPGPLDFLSPTYGSTVRESKIAVTGTAAPGDRVVEDIAKGFDRDTIVAADGTWSLEADLKRGSNLLKFRIGDEKATTRTLSVVYVP